MHTIRLIVGLGNPGEQYRETRHNAGFWFVESLAEYCGVELKPEKKFFGMAARAAIGGNEVRLLNPTVFMNRSGRSVAAICAFYKIPVNSVLVVHDELDLPVGVARLKQGGGHGGHNGLRDIISACGNDRSFYRLRVGIGHPGNSKAVVSYVLSRPSVSERQRIDETVTEAVGVVGDVVDGQLARAMQVLHSFTA